MQPALELCAGPALRLQNPTFRKSFILIILKGIIIVQFFSLTNSYMAEK